jgi:small GTP-binding protein
MPTSISSNSISNTNHTKKIQCVVLGAADAGKTSLLRRYFRQTFDSGRVPTVGSDFYTRRVTTSTTHNSTPTTVLLQMFDTPGEVPDPNRRRADHHEQQRHRQALLAAFAERMDGVLLVYDMTSTTSFVQLRQWHAQWRTHSKNQPILIVGNKRDLIPNNDTPTSSSSHRPAIPQRDVMGLMGSFTGKDFRYEYRVDHQVLVSNPQQQQQHGATTPPPATKNTGSTNNTNNSSSSLYKQPRSSTNTVSPYNDTSHHHRHYQISTFSATTDAGILWTQGQDGTYLDSLLTTEDNSNPDRDMVKLWCLRNGLQHVEVSCLEEQGNVDTAMETLVQSVLQARRTQQQPKESEIAMPTKSVQANHSAAFYAGPNETLDLLERYRPKDGKCCFCFPPIRFG